MVKANYKWLKAVLASRVKKLGPFFLASKLDKFPLFNDFFLNLADFWDLDNFQDLDNFLVFDNFLYFSIDSSSPSTPSISLLVSISLATNTYDDTVVFIIDVSGTAILLKP